MAARMASSPQLAFRWATLEAICWWHSRSRISKMSPLRRARQVIDGVDDGSGVRQDPLFDADDLIPRLDAEVPCQLFACAGGVDLDAVCMRIAAEAADQRIVFQFLVQAAAQVEHGAVDNGANAAHTLNVSGALHLAQCVPDHGTADTELGGKVYLRRQAVGVRVAAGAQLLQQGSDYAVTDDSAAKTAGRRKAGIFHGRFPPVHMQGEPRRDFRRRAAAPKSTDCQHPFNQYNIN